MRVPTRLYTAFAIAIAVLTALAAAPTARAQAAGPPPPGTWGAEASYIGGPGGSLLRFTSPGAAWLLGASFSLDRESSNQGDFFTGAPTSDYTNGYAVGRLGRRWYRGGAGAQLQPTLGAGLMGSYGSGSSSHQWQAGAYGEAGATWFFTPHLSLGGTGELSVLRGRRTQDIPTGQQLIERSLQVGGNLIRVNAAVYF